MCGRYYVDDEMAMEIEGLVQKLDHRLSIALKSGDLHPTDTAVVLQAEKDQITGVDMNWGFPQFHKSGVIFNARSETVLEKKSFSDSVLHRRCLIPARGFYEWDHMKNKNTFERPDHRIMLFAGIWKPYDRIKHFAILTTDANESMKPVHDRMPLILEPEEIAQWLYEDHSIPVLLHKKPLELSRIAGCTQETFDWR
ncbi:MAG: SOS response-associated peptidase [Lachnospiraceae bacterium]|nr:SOS response-associated peptidase [Lachnospiraceae bacterium]